MRDLTCLEVADSAPGFALDILEPERRARVAAHLLRCTDCRRAVADMEESAAELLGFQSAGSWADDPPLDGEVPAVRPGRRRIRMVVTMAAAAALLVGTTLGPELGVRRPERPVASGVLMAGSQAVGTVELFAGERAVIEVRADHLPVSGRLGVVVSYSDGSARRIGDIEVHGGRVSWAGLEPSGATEPATVVLVDSTLHRVAAASVG